MISNFLGIKNLDSFSLIPIEGEFSGTFDEDHNYLFVESYCDPFYSISSYAFFRNHLHELIVFNHLHHDFSTSDKFSVNVKLWKTWPSSIKFEPIRQLRIFKDIIRPVLNL